MCIRFSPDGNLLAAGFNNGTIKVGIHWTGFSCQKCGWQCFGNFG